MAVSAAQIQQLPDELAAARTQTVRSSTEQDNLRAQAQAAIAALAARMSALIAQQSSRDAQAEEKLDMVDFKAPQPEAFRGRREESWKVWSRFSKTYCKVRRNDGAATLAHMHARCCDCSNHRDMPTGCHVTAAPSCKPCNDRAPTLAAPRPLRVRCGAPCCT